MGVTKRVGAGPTASTTKRVAYNGDTTGSYIDCWGGAWLNTWGANWRTSFVGYGASPAVDVTKRVGSGITEGTTKRVTI